MEEIKNAHRQLVSECERLAFKCQVAEEDRQKLLLKVEKRQGEVNAVITEKNQVQSLLREKDVLIESL